jgi:hypothetical protein
MSEPHCEYLANIWNEHDDNVDDRQDRAGETAGKARALMGAGDASQRGAAAESSGNMGLLAD